MRAATGTGILLLIPLTAFAQKKGSEPAPLAVSAVGVSTPATVLVTWAGVSKVQRYEVARCDAGACAIKTTLSAFAPREYRETLAATGTYVYRVTAVGSRELPLAQGQATYQYSTTPLTVVLMPPPSGTITPINLCAAAPTHISVGQMGVTIQNSAPSGADIMFETWLEPDIVGHAVERAPAGTPREGGGWTTLATTCESGSRFSPATSGNGRPAYWFRDLSGGLTPSASYQYRARAVSSKGYYVVNVSPAWQAPAPIRPTLLSPAPPDPGDVGEVIMWIRWDQPLHWNGIRVREPDDYLITTSWGVSETRTNTRCTCIWAIRTGSTQPEMPVGSHTVTITARWGSVTASSTQSVSR